MEEREEMGIRIWMLAGSGCGDSRKLLANAGSREEVGSLASSLLFHGFLGRDFCKEGLECGVGSVKGMDWREQIARTAEVRKAHL